MEGACGILSAGGAATGTGEEGATIELHSVASSFAPPRKPRVEAALSKELVGQIEDSVKASGLNEGDIINRVNGVYFSNAAELGSILLDIGTAYLSDYQNFEQLDGSNMMAIHIKFGVRGREGGRTVVVDKLASSGVNRWPFPQPIIIREYSEGKKVDEEWYALES
ncbi:hypothetical protein E2562_026194 [Oryza meyeriana var. granulata]|uniref:Uncharacterized protein n=1 Tax=Oryza meyeriana var. granulata TaxID=110450 RepID=A0A6G1E2C1_9ORYZ|nr:hypothetical protein E2562_026194 [Oryza meyeriana var. granulata]